MDDNAEFHIGITGKVDPADYPLAEYTEHHSAEPLPKKRHGNKPRLDLIPTEALVSMARGFEFGSQQEGRTEWDWLIHPYDWSLYVGSMLRHAAAIARGELFDADGVPHAGKLMANAAILDTYRQLRIGNNDIRGNYGGQRSD